MNLLGLTILTPKGKARLEANAAAKAEAGVGHLIKRYATDDACLRPVIAARLRVKPDNLFIPAGSKENEARILGAFADAVIRERGEAST